ncbi:Gfo/Idh/MocA family oxidoreductase [Paenibacillus sp. IB182496]|uniref:Gfo/Idh/MocA family oxidoreductase n=1 Tax=Paenibacillus sabuli TaxID=2772509 RepID=A0A927GPZ2_9BACL|nr:Gfo/Idh/MocA family oxidoreductase [Paenibacillus sabuli]MBD2843828.1 Gfo/Idh/MocA family oxidoreductase [Paenibacillus sabuli]
MLRIGIWGLDTSHSLRFAELLNDPLHPYRVPGAVIAGMCRSRADGSAAAQREHEYMAALAQAYAVPEYDAPEALAAHCDALMLGSGDAAAHPAQAARAAPLGKPLFVNKPLAASAADGEAIFALADTHGVPLMSCSALRYTEPLLELAGYGGAGAITGADISGPVHWLAGKPDFLDYGIHALEALFAILGPDCRAIRPAGDARHDLIVGEWAGGRYGVVRGNRTGSDAFRLTVHYERASRSASLLTHEIPYVRTMLLRYIAMCERDAAPIEPQETLAVLRCADAVNRHRKRQVRVRL